MPSGSPLPATAIANPHTDNTSRIISASCRSSFVSWAIMGRTLPRETRRLQLKQPSDRSGADYSIAAIRLAFWILWFSAHNLDEFASPRSTRPTVQDDRLAARGGSQNLCAHMRPLSELRNRNRPLLFRLEMLGDVIDPYQGRAAC